MKLTFKTLSHSIMTLLVILVYSCQNDDFHTDKVVQPHAEANSYNRVPFSEVITATPFTTVEKILEMSVNFESKYNPNDYELDSNSFKKTSQADFLCYAGFLKNKKENNPNVFYNLVLYKLQGQWRKMILKCVKKFDANGHQTKDYDTFVIADEANKTGKCNSNFYTVDLFYCKAGHTDPACPDCSGCWRTVSSGFLNDCDQVYELDLNSGGGSTGDGGSGSGGGSSTYHSLQSINYRTQQL
jgi:hypothetical protein